MEVIYLCDDFIVINKPYGMLSERPAELPANGMVRVNCPDAIAEYLEKQGKKAEIFQCPGIAALGSDPCLHGFKGFAGLEAILHQGFGICQGNLANHGNKVRGKCDTDRRQIGAAASL